MVSSPTPPSTLEVAPPLPVLRTKDDIDMHGVVTPVPTRVGRFALIEQIGRGGMGIVYAAWDPQLDRKVAIKLVAQERFGDPEEARRRLEAEARAAAAISHPNIVGIYDVGVQDGRVFLAMEFVDGCTLGKWLRHVQRSWEDVVAMFVQVGRGLAAAHAAGLVHRDFKPDNVLLDVRPDDVLALGRPRVADFGLAWSREERRDAPATISGGSRSSGERSATPAVAGTPAYMAPEQFDGIDIGPAADQFAFCVALFEGVFGQRPFVGTSFEALSLAVRSGIDVPSRPAVPRRLVELVLRGLESDPTKRHASMETLLDGLAGLLRARRRRWLVGGAALVGVVALALGFRTAQAVAPAPCADTDDVTMLWTSETRASVGDARGARVLGELDAYAASFGTKRRDVCEATRVRGDQSDEVLSLRMACLDRVAARFDGLTTELADGAASRLDIGAITQRLPELAMCDDVEALAKLTNRSAARSSRSSTAQDRAWIDAVALVERALTRRMLGRDDARELAERAVDLARAYDLPGVHSRALSILADIALEAGDRDDADRLRKDAVRLAIADGHDDAAVHLMLDQADAALLEDRLADARIHLGYFEAFIERMTEADARADLEVRAEIVRGRLALATGDAVEAERRLTAVALDELGDLDKRAAWMALGTAQRALGRDAEAVATWTKLLALVEAMRGPMHVDAAAVINNLALVHLDAGNHRAADVLLARAESIVLPASDDALLATIATNRGWAARLAGRHDDARRHLDRALELGRGALGEKHPSLAHALDQLGELERELGNFDASVERFATAGELRDAGLGADHPETVTTLVGIARTFLALGKLETARGALEAARRIDDARTDGAKRGFEIDGLMIAAGGQR
jgi:tetratricopeptide (TPR) repeat protein/tRNA A-37 threonylcarbamoyl transferase component Bud32